MTLERVKIEAARTANRKGTTMAVLNLNTVGQALYVIRDYDPRMTEGPFAHQLVWTCHPSTIDGD